MSEELDAIDATPILAEEPITSEPAPVRPGGALAPATVQTLAVVGASVVTGAVVMAVAQKRKRRKIASRQQRGILPIVASRSFLVDVHVLGGDRK